MSWGQELLRRLVNAFAPADASPAEGAPSAGQVPERGGDTDDDYVEWAKEREFRSLMANWL